MTDEPTGFLYPFIDAEERDASVLLADLAASARAKIAQSEQLQATTLAQCTKAIRDAARAMAARFGSGGRLFTFGNGGSATDAAAMARLFIHPPAGRALPAQSLADDPAVLTALANDVGFDLVFSRQLIAHAGPRDIAFGFSTSGDSRNVLRAFDEAAGRGLLTIGCCGYDGGGMAASPNVAHCLVVRSDSVHRIQESQSAVVDALWAAVQAELLPAARVLSPSPLEVGP